MAVGSLTLHPGKKRHRLAVQRTLPLIGIGLLLILWAIGQQYTRYLPSPAAVWREAVRIAQLGDTYVSLVDSFRRLIIGLGMGYIAAFMVVLFMRRSPWWERFFSVYVFVALTIPSLAMALFSLIVFGLSEVGVYAAVAIIIFPFVVVNLNDGLKNVDDRLAEMARVFHFSWWQRLRHVALPEIGPYMFAAARNAHAFAWKLVVVTEVFSQRTGIGFQYKQALDYFDLEALVVWIIFFLAAVFLVEYGLLRPLEHRVSRWRDAMMKE